MSVKSLLQVILFLLIVSIIGGIYFIYFFKEEADIQVNLGENLEKFDNQKINEDEILEGTKLSKTDLSISSNSENISKNKLLKAKDNYDKENIQDNLSNEIKNLTKEIEYTTSNKNGDIFRILAKYGKTNIKNSYVLDLENVKGIISSADRSEINIVSDKAEYNYANQDSKFYGNVEIKYDQNKINCDNFEIKLKDNIAVAYSNVILTNNSSIIKADVVEIDILTKNININSENKAKIIKN